MTRHGNYSILKDVPDFGPPLQAAQGVVFVDHQKELADLRNQKDSRLVGAPGLQAAFERLHQLMPGPALDTIYRNYVDLSSADQTPVVASTLPKVEAVNEGPVRNLSAKPKIFNPMPSPFGTQN